MKIGLSEKYLALKRTLNSMSIAKKAAVAYLIGNILTKGLGLITTPFYTRMMPVESVGEYSTFSSWHSILGVVATLSLSGGMFEVAMSDYADARDRYSSAMLGLSTLSALLTIGVYLLTPSLWNGMLSLSARETQIMLLSFLLVPPYSYVLVRLRFEYKYKQLLALSLTSAFLCAVLPMSLVYIAKQTAVLEPGLARIAGTFLPQCLLGAVCGVYLLRKDRRTIDLSIWKYALRFNIPLIFGALASRLLDISDRTMIASISGKREAGIYGTLYMLSTLAGIALSAITSSLIPYTFERLKNGEEKKVKKAVNPIFTLYGVGSISLMLFAPEIVRILATDEYYESVYIMPPIACGIFFTSIANIFGIVPQYFKKTAFIMGITIFAAVLNVGLNYIFINAFGYYAAAYTTLACYFVQCALYYILLKRILKVDVFDMKFTILLSLAVIGATFLCLLLYGLTWLRYIAIAGVAAGLIANRRRLVSILKGENTWQ